MKAFTENLREFIKVHPEITLLEMIRRLDSRLRGWANYFKGLVSDKAFAKVDTTIYWALWRWAKRKHPKKPAYWLLRKYTRRNYNGTKVISAPRYILSTTLGDNWLDAFRQVGGGSEVQNQSNGIAFINMLRVFLIVVLAVCISALWLLHDSRVTGSSSYRGFAKAALASASALVHSYFPRKNKI